MAKMNTQMPHMQRLYGRGKDVRLCEPDQGRCSICGGVFLSNAVVCVNGHIRQHVYRLPRVYNMVCVPTLALKCESDGRYCSLCHCDFGEHQLFGFECPNCRCTVGTYHDLDILTRVSVSNGR